MNKLDAFLENNWNEQDLETYGKQHPDVSIHIFSGEESELCRELETHKLDIHWADYPKSNHAKSTMEEF